MHSFFKPTPERSPGPRLAGERIEIFYDRVEGSYWDEIRRTADEFLNRMPESARQDVVGRWRSGQDDAATSAWWEVYLHEWLIRSGFEVTVHPLQTNGRSPDFVAASRGIRIYIEATGPGTPRSQRSRTNLLNDLYHQLNQVASDRYSLHVVHVDEGEKPIRFRRMRERAEEWLWSLGESAATPSPPLVLVDDGWRVELVARPRRRPPEAWLGPRAISIFPMEGGTRQDVQDARRLVETKRNAYGQLDAPLIIAVWTPRFIPSPASWETALYGSSSYELATDGTVEHSERMLDGLWGVPGDRRDQHIGGILIGQAPSFHTIAGDPPHWWPHPAGSLSDLELSPFVEVHVDEQPVQAPDTTAHEFFELPDPWPPARPYDRQGR